ncbi:MAG TPA: hypothetical protein VLY24_00600 [Bryobacteraceae bacterium]|nr:hypothetical protein [Bryobacteraceae bacterium]
MPRYVSLDRNMRVVSALALACAWLLTVAGLHAAQPIIDNERVSISDVTWEKGQANPSGPQPNASVTVWLTAGAMHKAGDAVYSPPGAVTGEEGTRFVVIDLKDHPVPGLPNTSGYPNAFPRPRVKKVLENDKVIVWAYAWKPGVPTPMHFHDKDVVVTYFEDGPLKSTTPDGKGVVNDYKFGMVRFNRRDRSHTETLVSGNQHAVMVELKP